MNTTRNNSPKQDKDNIPADLNDSDESLENKEQGLPPVGAENFDDAGDLDGLQLGLATAPKENFSDATKILSKDGDEVTKGSHG